MTRIQYVSCATKKITTRFYTHNHKWKVFVLGTAGTQTFWTCSKNLYRPAEATRTRRILFELIVIVIVIVIARMTRNDQEWSPEQTQIVNSSSFGSRFHHLVIHMDQFMFICNTSIPKSKYVTLLGRFVHLHDMPSLYILQHLNTQITICDFIRKVCTLTRYA